MTTVFCLVLSATSFHLSAASAIRPLCDRRAFCGAPGNPFVERQDAGVMAALRRFPDAAAPGQRRVNGLRRPAFTAGADDRQPSLRDIDLDEVALLATRARTAVGRLRCYVPDAGTANGTGIPAVSDDRS